MLDAHVGVKAKFIKFIIVLSLRIKNCRLSVDGISYNILRLELPVAAGVFAGINVRYHPSEKFRLHI